METLERNEAISWTILTCCMHLGLTTSTREKENKKVTDEE